MDEATVATLEAYRIVFRERIEAHRGRIVDMAGDSVPAAFEAATALAAAQKIDMPGYIRAAAARVAAFGHLGRLAEAQTDIERILELDPNFEATARQKREKWFRFQEPLLDQFMDGLRKAGLKIPPKTA